MSERPPDEPGDGDNPTAPDPTGSDDESWDTVASQVEAALDDAGVIAGDLRSALLDSLRGALGRLGEVGEVDVSVDVRRTDDEAGGRPDVTVVDGGRTPNQPRSTRPRPSLRVAEGLDGDPPAPRSIKVVGSRATGRDGSINVPADGRQAVFRGQKVRPYRVRCDSGRLAVSVDGVTVETLSPGQSLDVEGSVVVVLAADESPATGTYRRLT